MKLVKLLTAAVLLFCILLLLFAMTGCVYSKKGCIQKVCKTDTVRAEITVHDTVVVNSITSDTVFSTDVDTVTLVKDKLVIRYQKIAGKIHLSGEYKGDTIIKEKIVKVAIPANCPPLPEPTWWDKVIQFFAILGALAIIVAIAVIVLR